jgi:co-chaperonin GroES (HSP10)
MKGIHSYLVEIDLNWYKRLESNGHVYETPARAGQKGAIEPRHGKVVVTLPNSKVKVGHTIFFVHFELYKKDDRDNKTYVLVSEEQALGYATRFPDIWSEDSSRYIDIQPLHFLVGSKIENPKWHENQKAPIQDPTIPKEFVRIYECLSGSENIKKGDLVWTYVGSEYFIDYLPNHVFLDRKYITFNQSKNKPLSEYVLIEVKDIGKQDNGLIEDASRKKKLQGLGVVKTTKKGLKVGDAVRWDISLSQVSPINERLFTVPYHLIISKIEPNNA